MKHSKARELYKYLKEHDKKLCDEIMEEFIDKMEVEALGVFAERLHLDDETYHKAVDLLEWSNGVGKGANWSVEEVKKVSGIDFDKTKEFNEYDLAYLMNWRYSDYCKVITDPLLYVKMCKLELTDPDPVYANPIVPIWENAHHRILKYG